MDNHSVLSTVQKWGNSLAIRIPSSMANQVSIREGSEIELRIEQDALIISHKKRPKKIYFRRTPGAD